MNDGEPNKAKTNIMETYEFRRLEQSEQAK